MPKPIEFEGTIEAARGGGACIPVPFDPKQTFGTGRSTRVTATFDGYEASSSVVTMDGRAVLGVHKATREAIGKGPGDRVRVSLVRDDAPRTVTIPPELEAALASSPDEAARYAEASYTHRKEFARWVAEAKRQETRDRRAAKAVDMLSRGEWL